MAPDDAQVVGRRAFLEIAAGSANVQAVVCKIRAYQTKGVSMNRIALVCLFASGVTGFAGAQAETFFDNARVRSAEPQYESVSIPRQECSSQVVNETRQVSGGQNYGGAVVGGVAGALLGNQVGKGHGREAATAVGAVVGALAGNNIANQNRQDQYQVVPREVTSCRTVNELQTRLTGYRVTYDYRGMQYSTILRDNPGPNLQVRVSVDPVVQ